MHILIIQIHLLLIYLDNNEIINQPGGRDKTPTTRGDQITRFLMRLPEEGRGCRAGPATSGE